MLLWTALWRLCALGQLIVLLQQHWQFVVHVKEIWEVVLPRLRANQRVISVVLGLFAGLFALVTLLVFSYYLLVGLFALAGAVHIKLLSTIVVALLMVAFYCSVAYLFYKQLEEHENYARPGFTDQNVLIAGLFVLEVTIQLFLGQLLGTIVVSCLVVAFSYIEHEKYSDRRKGWTPAVDGLNVCIVMAMYHLLSGLFTLLLAIHSYSGLSSATCFTLVVALLLVNMYRDSGRMVWLEVRKPVVKAAVLFVMWWVLFALVVAYALLVAVIRDIAQARYCFDSFLSVIVGPREGTRVGNIIIAKIAILLQGICG